MRQWKLMTGRDCDELRMAWVMTYVLPVIAFRRFSPRLRTSDNGNRVTDRWKTIVTKTSNGIRERKIPPRSNKHRVVKTRRWQRAGVSLRGDLCHDSWSLSHLGYLYPGTTPVMIKLDHNRSCPRVKIAQVTKAPTISSLHCLNTIWARGLSWINEETHTSPFFLSFFTLSSDFEYSKQRKKERKRVL